MKSPISAAVANSNNGFRRQSALCVSAALGLGMALPVFAQDASTAPATSEVTELFEIIVTARRKDESLQDVPTVVDVVTADSLAKLNIQKFEDIQALVPGLTLSSGNTGYSTTASVRGVSFAVESSASPTVAYYLNDAPVDSNVLFQTMYDVGQIEVLRGPQGTLRGVAAPSGSITLTTRRPDLSETGGYVSASGSSIGSRNGHGAFNLPIVQDVFAVRIAGLMDNNDYDDVRSINNESDPSQKTRAARLSLRFEPTDAISANLSYHYLKRDLTSFAAVESLSLIDPTVVPVDPVIHGSDRRGITDGRNFNHQKMDLFTGAIDWRFAGQKLSYVGSWYEMDLEAESPQDTGNGFADREWNQFLHTYPTTLSHELRLGSEERVLGMFSYTVGAYFFELTADSDLTNQQAVLLPAFLGGGIASIVDVPISRRSNLKETSAFANLTWHIGEKTELSGGVRYMNVESEATLDMSGSRLSATSDEQKPTIYNVSLSHRFTDDFMAYANSGSSWRAGPSLIGVFRPLTPNLDKYTNLTEEKSKSYELGVKSSLLDGRARLNAAVFRQEFDGYIYRGVPVWYVGLSQAGFVPSTFNFGSNVDVKVDGVELDSAFQVTPQFSIGAAVSYAKGNIENSFVACTDLNGDGVPDVNPGTPTIGQLQASIAPGEAVAQCRVNDPSSFAPEWSATLQSEYSMPVLPTMDAYLRGLLSYYPSNDQDPNNVYDDVDNYGLLNLFIGVRDPQGAWEVSLYAKNATNTRKSLSRGSGPQTTAASQITGFGPPVTTTGVALESSYLTSRYTPQREFGVSVRYAFGSR